jgi:hypothetical protein
MEPTESDFASFSPSEIFQMGQCKSYFGNPKRLIRVLKNSRKRAAGNEPVVPAPVIAEEAEKLYCICRIPNGHPPMIKCDSCEEWFHFRCKDEGLNTFTFYIPYR